MQKHKCGEKIKVMGDYGSSGLWCGDCGVMIEPEQLNLPKEIVFELELNNWIRKLNATIWDEDEIVIPGGFDKTGLAISEKIRKAVGNKYRVFYFPFK